MTETFLKLLQPVIAMGLAPLLLGVINRVKALFAGRRGQPLLQPYYDLWRLLQKSAVYSTATSWVFRAAPVIGLAAVIGVLGLLPLGRGPALLSFGGDFILAAYLLALVRFFLVIAALDTGSSFEGMGASREVLFSALAEPALFLALAAMARQTAQFSLSGIFAAVTPGLWAAEGGVLLLVAACLMILLLAENSRIPVDDPNTHLELTMIHEVMILDHSGPDLAFLLYGAALKLWIFAGLLVGMLLPAGAMPTWLSVPAAVAAIFAVAVLVGVIESCMARLRMARVPYLLFTAAAMAILALVFALKSGVTQP